MDCGENFAAGRGSGHLRLFARISGAGNAHAQDAHRFYRAGTSRGLRRAGGVPPRAHAFRAKEGPHRAAAAHARADRELFMLYNDPPRLVDTLLEEATHAAAPQELRDEFGVAHRLWPVTDVATIRRIQSAMADKKLIIADGHHRYETALNFRDESRKAAGVNDPYAAAEFAMMTFINTHSKGLTILPTHRLIRNVAN